MGVDVGGERTFVTFTGALDEEGGVAFAAGADFFLIASLGGVDDILGGSLPLVTCGAWVATTSSGPWTSNTSDGVDTGAGSV